MSAKSSHRKQVQGSFQSIKGKSVRGLAKDLYFGVAQDFLGYFTLGAATSLGLASLRMAGKDGNGDAWLDFFDALRSHLSDLSPRILFAAIFVVCTAVFLRGYWKSPLRIERYLLHPFLALTADTSASAMGFFLVSLALSPFPTARMEVGEAILGLGYFTLAACIFWLGRAIAFRHGNRRIWGTRSNPQFNTFRFVLRWAGLGGAVVSLLVVLLYPAGR